MLRPPLAVTLVQSLQDAGFEGESFEGSVTDVQFAVLAAYVALESPSANPQAVVIVKALTAIGARQLFQRIAGWNPANGQEVLSADLDRIYQLSGCTRNRHEVPKDTITLPGWLTVRKMLVAAGEDSEDENSLLQDSSFRFWINRHIADTYRIQYGVEPPTVSKNKSTSYVYPPSYQSYVNLYRSNWICQSD